MSSWPACGVADLIFNQAPMSGTEAVGSDAPLSLEVASGKEACDEVRYAVGIGEVALVVLQRVAQNGRFWSNAGVLLREWTHSLMWGSIHPSNSSNSL